MRHAVLRWYIWSFSHYTLEGILSSSRCGDSGLVHWGEYQHMDCCDMTKELPSELRQHCKEKGFLLSDDTISILSKYQSLENRKPLLSWLENRPCLVHRRRNNMTGPGITKSASSDWPQWWSIETPELHHSPALFRLSDITGGAFTMLGLRPVTSFTPWCLKNQLRPNSSWSLNFWTPDSMHVADHGDYAQLLPVTWWVSNKTEAPASPNLLLSPVSVTSASWLP